jgi:hypothetical protein
LRKELDHSGRVYSGSIPGIYVAPVLAQRLLSPPKKSALVPIRVRLWKSIGDRSFIISRAFSKISQWRWTDAEVPVGYIKDLYSVERNTMLLKVAIGRSDAPVLADVEDYRFPIGDELMDEVIRLGEEL